MKKYTVFALMAIICAGCIRFIFAPSADEKTRQEAQTGFNTDIPMPQDRGLVGDKRDAYEQERVKQRQEERMRSLQDFSSLLGDTQKPDDDLALLEEPEKAKVSGGTGRTDGAGSQSSPESSIQNSARAYRDINRTLGNFYETPQTDPEKEKLQQELEELRKRLATGKSGMLKWFWRMKIITHPCRNIAKRQPFRRLPFLPAGIIWNTCRKRLSAKIYAVPP
ncbi:MAG: hypothetical protein LBK58_09810 [Prevotellaceae bacterium]|nr:hypothetical protein [Prevotellaceae bacterium]